MLQKCQYLGNEKRYFEKKNAIFLYFERPLKYAKNTFLVMYTLSETKKEQGSLNFVKSNAKVA